MKPTIDHYIEYAMDVQKIRFSLEEIVEAYRKVVADMIQRQEYQIECHENGSYGKPPNLQKIEDIRSDIELMKTYLESK